MNPILFHDPIFQQWALVQVPLAVLALMLPIAYWWSWSIRYSPPLRGGDVPADALAEAGAEGGDGNGHPHPAATKQAALAKSAQPSPLEGEGRRPPGRFRTILTLLNWQLVGVYVNWLVQLVGWSFFWEFMQAQQVASVKDTVLMAMQFYFGVFAVFIAYLYARIGLRRALGQTKTEFALTRYVRMKLLVGVALVYVPVYTHVLGRLLVNGEW